MLKSLPPVGNPISLTSVDEPEKVFESVFGDRSVFLYGSGTMALAASLVAAREFRGITTPEIILPAYACPDLVSAALFAGVKPVLVDLEAGTPWMNLDKLKQQIGPSTIAVIAVHLLGITERLAEIREVLSGTDVLLIEDSAQLFPKTPSDSVWQGDMVILSFGRGKPVSLLGGGAVMCRDEILQSHLPQSHGAALSTIVVPLSLNFKGKATLYNKLIKPNWYVILASMPFLQLGETRYKPLDDLIVGGVSLPSLLATNIKAYINRELKAQLEISKMIKELRCNEVLDLSAYTSNDPSLPLLRYPLLLKTPELRDRLLNNLSRLGLGASKMYPAPLPGIDGLENKLPSQDQFPESKSFSQRLLTLPCHLGVSNRDIQRIGKTILASTCL